jgi:nucleotide-binding universal stress UspA family protein
VTEDRTTASSSTRVVVGVDESASAQAALRQAAQVASEKGVELVVVHAWEPPFEHAHGSETTRVLRVLGLQQATQLLDELIERARQEDGWEVAHVTALPVQGEVSEVLRSTARPDDLLVVGSGAGAVRRLLLGSVSAKVVRSARGPVLVVPAPQRRRKDRRPAQCRPAGRRDRTALTFART